MIPDLSVVWVIAFVLLLSVVLDRLLLRPMTATMQQREGAIRAARELAETSRTRARAAAEELEAKTAAARADIYRQMDEKRRAALERRTTLLAARMLPGVMLRSAGAVTPRRIKRSCPRKPTASNAICHGAAPRTPCTLS